MLRDSILQNHSFESFFTSHFIIVRCFKERQLLLKNSSLALNYDEVLMSCSISAKHQDNTVGLNVIKACWLLPDKGVTIERFPLQEIFWLQKQQN